MLCSIAEPNYGLITNIGRAHLDGFGGPEGVRRGKGRAVRLPGRERRSRLVCRDDDVLTPMAAERDPLAAEYYPATLAEGMRHRLEGEYNRFNIAAAVAVGRYFDIDEERIRHAVAGYVPDNHRSQRIETPHNTVLADCYNANPSSMRAAIGHFRTESAGTHTQKALILGDMLRTGRLGAGRARSDPAPGARRTRHAVSARGAAFAAAADSVRRAPDAGAAAERIRCYPLARGAGSRPRSTSADRRPRAGQGSHGMRPRPTPGHTLSGTEQTTDGRRNVPAPVFTSGRTAAETLAPCRTSDRSTPSGPGLRPRIHPASDTRHRPSPNAPQHDRRRHRTKDRQQTEDKRTERKQAAVLRRTAERMDARSASGARAKPDAEAEILAFRFSLNLSVVQSKRDP